MPVWEEDIHGKSVVFLQIWCESKARLKKKKSLNKSNFRTQRKSRKIYSNFTQNDCKTSKSNKKLIWDYEQVVKKLWEGECWWT